MDEEVEFTDRYLRIAGMKAHLRDGGSGTPLVLIHGLGGPLMWQRVLQPLGRRLRVLVVDLPGFGESDAPSRAAPAADHGAYLAEMIDLMELRHAVLCGISWGAEQAVRLADRCRDRVERMILICGTGLRHRPYVDSSLFRRCVPPLLGLTALRSGFMIDYFSRRSFYRIENRPPDLCSRFREGLRRDGRREAFSKALMAAIAGERDFTARLSRLTLPSLIIWGENDALVPKEDADRFHQYLPNSTVRILPQCGHSVPLEKPRELVDAVFMFTETGGYSNEDSS